MAELKKRRRKGMEKVNGERSVVRFCGVHYLSVMHSAQSSMPFIGITSFFPFWPQIDILSATRIRYTGFFANYITIPSPSI
jgi:hypothetical protein